jgi:hypothetical protein
MPAKRQELVVNELIVTGPLKERLYDLFTRVYAGRNDVRVIMDRRGDARRRPEQAPTEQAPPERREPDRRRRPPTWIFPPSD